MAKKPAENANPEQDTPETQDIAATTESTVDLKKEPEQHPSAKASSDFRGKQMKEGETVVLNGDKNVSVVKMGERRYTGPAAIISMLYRSHFDEWINVPVQTIRSTFLFNFKQMVETTKLRDLRVNDDILLSIVQHLIFYRDILGSKLRTIFDGTELEEGEYVASKVRNKDGDVVNNFQEGYKIGKIKDYLYDKLMSPNQGIGLSEAEANEICILLIDNMDRYLIRGIVTQSVLRSAMEEQLLSQFESNGGLNSGLDTDPTSISATIHALQDFYAQVCVTDSVDAFGQSLTDIINTDKNLLYIYTIRRVLQESRSPYVPVRFGAFREAFETQHSIRPILDKQPIIGDLVYKVKHVSTEFNGIRRRDIFAFLMKSYAEFVGDIYADKILDPVDPKTYIKMATSWSQQANRAFLGFPDEWWSGNFFVASGYSNRDPQSKPANSSSKQVLALFKRVYLTEVLRRMMDPIAVGLFSSRVKALIDERVLAKSELWNFTINRSLDAAAILLDAYASTLAYMRSLASDTSIYFIDDDDRYTADIIAFVNQNIDKLSTPTLPMSHPASIRELSILLQQPSDYDGPVYPGLTLSDAAFRTIRGGVYNPITDSFAYFYMNDIIKGSLLDCPISIPRNVIANRLCTPLRPKFTFTVPLENELAGTSVGDVLLRVLDVKELLTSDAFYFLRQHIEFRYFVSATDLIDMFKLPYEWANYVIDRSMRSGNMIVVAYYTGPLQQSLLFEPDQLPIWEFGPSPADDQYMINQFVSKWPFYATAEHAGYMIPPTTALGISSAQDVDLTMLLDRRNAALTKAYKIGGKEADLDASDHVVADYDVTPLDSPDYGVTSVESSDTSAASLDDQDVTDTEIDDGSGESASSDNDGFPLNWNNEVPDDDELGVDNADNQ